jgi:hypothetical protein
VADVAVLRTWGLRRMYHRIRREAAGHPEEDWQPLGIRKLGCGCFVDDFSDGVIWEPCMAHEGDGHLAAVSEQDGLHVARCLVVTCPWTETWLRESDAVGAAQQHWLMTRNS